MGPQVEYIDKDHCYTILQNIELLRCQLPGELISRKGGMNRSPSPDN